MYEWPYRRFPCAHVNVPEDLEGAVHQAVQAGDVTRLEAEEAYRLLSERIAAAADRGWFPSDADRILNEASLIDTDGQICRPDRVVIVDGKVIIIDYKFGEHNKAYVHQLRKYAGIPNANKKALEIAIENKDIIFITKYRIS